MSIEDNKAIVSRIVAEIWNRTNLEAADELYTPDYSRNGEVIGPAGVKRLFATITSAMPDLLYTIEDMIAEGDRVMFRAQARGTHSGEWAHPILGRIAPTGRQITMRGLTIYRIVHGKAAEGWTFGDSIGALKQLGATIVLSQQATGATG